MNNDWANDFDKQFGNHDNSMFNVWKVGDAKSSEKTFNELKSFIQSLLDKQADEAAEMQDEAYHKGYGDALRLLDKQREELREWAEGMKVEVGESVLPTLSLSTLNEAHNQVLDDLLTKLEKE